VRSVEAAGAEKANCHAGTGAHESGERLAVRGDEVTTFAAFAFETRVAKVEDEIAVFRKQVEAVGGSVGEEELLGEGWAGDGGCRWCRAGGGRC